VASFLPYEAHVHHVEAIKKKLKDRR